MSRPFNDIINGLKDWNSNSDEYVISEAKDYEAEIIDMNIESMDIAIDNEGDSFLGLYHPSTIAMKNATREPYLTDTGDLKDKMRVRFKDDYLALFSNASKTPKVENKFGKEIFGLNDEQVKDLIEMVRPNIINRFRKTVFR